MVTFSTYFSILYSVAFYSFVYFCTITRRWRFFFFKSKPVVNTHHFSFTLGYVPSSNFLSYVRYVFILFAYVVLSLRRSENISTKVKCIVSRVHSNHSCKSGKRKATSNRRESLRSKIVFLQTRNYNDTHSGLVRKFECTNDYSRSNCFRFRA